MKVAELKRWLKARGCTFEEGTKHTRVLRGERFTFLPRHPAEELKTGTAQGILKRLGFRK